MAVKNGLDGAGGRLASVSLPGEVTSIVFPAPFLAKRAIIHSSSSKRLEDIAILLLN
jgi:hypothetical protein